MARDNQQELGSSPAHSSGDLYEDLGGEGRGSRPNICIYSCSGGRGAGGKGSYLELTSTNDTAWCRKFNFKNNYNSLLQIDLKRPRDGSHRLRVLKNTWKLGRSRSATGDRHRVPIFLA